MRGQGLLKGLFYSNLQITEVDHLQFSFILFSSLQAVSKFEENWTELDVLVRPACYIVVQEAASPSRGLHNLGDKKRLVVHSNKADTGYSTTVEPYTFVGCIHGRLLI